jgi:hypothetical protein
MAVDMKPSLGKSILISALALIVAAGALSCGGGGGGGGGGNSPPPTSDVTITNITYAPAAPATNSLVELTVVFTSKSPPASLTKNWSVPSGVLQDTYPDFTFTPRAASAVGKKPSLSTTASTVYWATPSDPGSYNVSVAIGSARFSRAVTLTVQPIAMSVTTASDGKKVAAVTAVGVTDLYQVAFRINYNATAYSIDKVTIGDFLGAPSNVLSLVVTSLPTTVAVAITKKGNVTGASGSGILATVAFKPRTGTSAVKSASVSPALSVSVRSARDSKNREITR